MDRVEKRGRWNENRKQVMQYSLHHALESCQQSRRKRGVKLKQKTLKLDTIFLV